MQPDPPNPAHADELRGNAPEDLLARALESQASGPAPGAWTPPDPEHLSRLLPEYPIECLIGRGGMGAVYKARQRRLNRTVAVKVLPAELAQDNEFVMRFHREARLLASLNHPGIVTIFDFGQTTEGHLYFVMEHVEGTDLHRLIHQSKLDPKQALNLTIQICEAMQYAHDNGVIHRDIKPANVLVTPDWRVKLADFGLALKPAEHAIEVPEPPQPDVFDPRDPMGVMALRFTKPGTAMGTVDYAAPEVYEGKADERSDIYALGIMLYEMLTGETPKGYFALPSARSKVDRRVDKVVVKALEIEPAERYQKASDMKLAVEQATMPLPADPPPARQPAEEVRMEIIPPGTRPERSRAKDAEGGPTRSKGSAAELVIIAVLVLGGAGAWYAKVHLPVVKNGITSVTVSPAAPNTEDGFVPLLDRDHRDGWQQCGPGGMDMEDGVATLWREKDQKVISYYCYTRRSFKDFTLRLDLKITSPTGNSGVPLRFPHPGTDPHVPDNNYDHYHVDISDTGGGLEATGAIMFVQSPTSVPMKVRQWNELEITATGQHYLVKLNGQIVNDFTGNRSLEGYLGLQNFRPDGVQFRNLRIKELPESKPQAGEGDLKKALLASDWSFHNRAVDGGQWDWDITFLSNGTARTHNEKGYMRTWHWWSTGGRIIHVQTGADPAAFDPKLGFDFSFNDSFTSYTGEKTDHLQKAHGDRKIRETPSGTNAAGQTFTNSLGMEFVTVPGTKVQFCIHDTRNVDYAAYAQANSGVNTDWKIAARPGKDLHPVVNVTWDEARAFCAWLSQKEGKTYRLPTDHEWSVAAGIGDLEDERATPESKNGKIHEVYPWDGTFPPPSGAGNFAGSEALIPSRPKNRPVIAGLTDGYPLTSPVGTFKANRFGLYDMAGNVAQWVEDKYSNKDETRVMRGSSFFDEMPRVMLSSGRGHFGPKSRYNNCGFRVVLAPKG